MTIAGAALLVPLGARALYGQEISGLQAAAAIEQAMTQAIAKAERSVVSIARVRRDEQDTEPRVEFDRFGQMRIPAAPAKPTDPDFVPNEFATGVIIDASGLILTNFHVIDKENSEHLVTTIDRKVYHTEVKGANRRSDLAVLKVIGPVNASEFTPIKFGNAEKLKKGQIVIALGNPYAIARDGQASASWGIISNLSRKEAAPQGSAVAKTLPQLGTLIQTDAKLNLGTSGGALLNLKGEMIGLTTSVAAISGYDQSAGYAIPVDASFLRIVETLKTGREVEYGFLGIAPENLVAGRQGIRVGRVSMGTPARRAGLVAGDIITQVNGAPIHDADGLRLEVGKLPATVDATLTIERGDSRGAAWRTLVEQVTLAKFPADHQDIVTVREPAWRGLRVDYRSAVLGSDVLDDSFEAMVAVSEVKEKSPAYVAGLRPGMLITHVGTTPVDRPDEFRREVAAKTGAVALKLVVGPGEYHTVTVEP